jgi:hypothetical protein
MSVSEYLGRLPEHTAVNAAASFAARLMATPSQAAGLESLDLMSPAANDLSRLANYDTGLAELVEGLEPNAASPWHARASFHEITTAAAQTLSRAVAPPLHRAFTAVIQADDFKTVTAKFSWYGTDLVEIPEHAEYPVAFADAGESDTAAGRVSKYGAAVAITRVELIEDRRLGFLGRMTEALVGSAYRKEASLIYGALEVNANLSDGAPWFDASNTASAASVPTAIAAGFDLLHEQTFPNGDYVDPTPAVLVVPTAWHVLATDMIHDLVLQKLAVITSPRVTSAYLFADPAQCPAVGLLALAPGGVPEIRIQQRPKSGFLTDTAALAKVTHAIAPLPLSRRGVVKIEVS